MGISAPAKSEQYVDFTSNPTALRDPLDDCEIKYKRAKLTFTAAGYTTAAAGDIKLMRMPAGKVRIYPDLSRLICPQGTSSADLDIGYSAWEKTDKTLGTADYDGLAASLDVGGGALDQTLPLPAGGELEIESTAGFDISCSFDTANSPAAGDLILVVAYTKVGG